MKRSARFGLKYKVIAPIVILGVGITLAANYYIQKHAADQAVLMATDSARGLAVQTSELRKYYTKAIVSRAKAGGIQATHDYGQRTGAIPLPATLVHELNAIVNQHDGSSLRLFSDYPFPFRKDGGAQDAFEREALQFLRANPTETFSRLDQYKGQPALRYAMADVMSAQGCVDCHNSHALSPKRDWRIGDVRGVLEVVVPVQRSVAAAQQGGLRMGLIFGGLMLLMVLLTALNVRRLLSGLSTATGVAGQIADGDLSGAVAITSDDELGDLQQSLGHMSERLAETMREVREAVDGVSVAASQVYFTTASLAQGGRQQVVSVEIPH